MVKLTMAAMETELIPLVKTVRVTTSRTAPLTSPSRMMKGKSMMMTTSQMLRMTMMIKTSQKVMTMEVTWKTIRIFRAKYLSS